MRSADAVGGDGHAFQQSVRVGLAYRALGVRDTEEIIWFWIGSHADYDQLLRDLARWP
jgi:hypothetical protein